ncbi:MAG: UvrD-helicase domain-containing protein, partial [Lachnospiraceae bacterium]|nr:UvrD-helicase domain-containing protein [Lachnospiraceae bacterium]
MKALREREFPAETVRHLKRQLILVERADVCTIDSFCMRLVKSEIHLSEFDPSFRLVDNSEAELLETDVLSELMEEQYAEAGEDFIALTDYFSSVGAGNTAEDQILRLFHFMRNAADPLKWLDNCRKLYEIDSEEALQAAPWNVRYLKRMRSRFDGFVTAFEKLERLVNREHIESYLSTVSEYRDMLRIGEPPETYRDFFDLARRASDAMEKRLPALKKTDSGPESERAKYALSDFRNSFKKWINNFSRLPETIVKEFERMRPIADTLIGLTKTYSERLKEEKNKRRVADFNDVEHEALRILKPDGVISDAAKALRDRYEEILIDEYQDSSELQEEILNSVARTVDSKSVNVFMVGDMKQSIYRFRMADPELFIDKYDTYPSVRDGDALTGKVELSANFRSRSVVTDTVNFFFRKLMQKGVDGVGYDDAAALDPRRVFTVTDQRHAEKSVLMTLSADEDVTEPEGPAQEENEDPADEEADVTLVEMEAHLIAKEILKLVDRKDPLYIEDRDHPGKVRPVNFGDIVILMRSTKIADQTFSEVFASYGIPCYSEQKSGFYDTFEIRFLINLLSAIDNPENDTAFFGVLRSGLFDVTSNELAEVKAKCPDNALPGSLYRSVLAYVSEFDDPAAKKLKEILDLIGRYEILSHEADLSLLIRTIAGETGLESFAAAMPGGARRLGNIRLLEEKAADFEKTS